MTQVKISYDPDLSKIGTIQEVSADEARRLVRRGRAIYVKAEPSSVDEVQEVAPHVADVIASVSVPEFEAPYTDSAEERDEIEGTSLDLDDDED